MSVSPDAFLATYHVAIAMLPADWEVGIKTMPNTEPGCRFRSRAQCARDNESFIAYGASEAIAVERLRESITRARTQI